MSHTPELLSKRKDLFRCPTCGHKPPVNSMNFVSVRLYFVRKYYPGWEFVDDGSITLESLNDLLLRQDCKCPYCHGDISKKKDRHLDHTIPINPRAGGGHTIDNVKWVCKDCNERKKDMTGEEFIKKMNKLAVLGGFKPGKGQKGVQKKGVTRMIHENRKLLSLL